jgi:hypothetical protein
MGMIPSQPDQRLIRQAAMGGGESYPGFRNGPSGVKPLE